MGILECTRCHRRIQTVWQIGTDFHCPYCEGIMLIPFSIEIDATIIENVLSIQKAEEYLEKHEICTARDSPLLQSIQEAIERLNNAKK